MHGFRKTIAFGSKQWDFVLQMMIGTFAAYFGVPESRTPECSTSPAASVCRPRDRHWARAATACCNGVRWVAMWCNAVRWVATHGSVLAPCCGARRRGAGIRTTVGRHEIEPWQTAVDACAAQRATDNTQQTTDNTQHATDNRQRATRNGQHATDNRQRATDNGQRTTDRRAAANARCVSHGRACVFSSRRHRRKRMRMRYDCPLARRDSVHSCAHLRDRCMIGLSRRSAPIRSDFRAYDSFSLPSAHSDAPDAGTPTPPPHLRAADIVARACARLCLCVRACARGAILAAGCADRGGRSAALVRSQGTTSTTLRPSCSGSSDTRSASSRHPFALLRLSRSQRRARPHPLCSHTPLPSDTHPQPFPSYPKP